jgi:hypothetical protein
MKQTQPGDMQGDETQRDDRQHDETRYREISLDADDGSSLYALINGDLGWLLYFREPGDPGFSSRNPDYGGPPDATLDYRLGNGQGDAYPLAWALRAERIQEAFAYFRRHGKPPPFINWHDDSEEGRVLTGE